MSTPLRDRLALNLAAVEQRIQAATLRAGRDRGDVQLVAVVKYAQWNWVLELIDLGVRHLAENRPQQLTERVQWLQRDRPGVDVHWHMIGHLQRNKVRPALTAAALIHSVDSLRLLERINVVSAELDITPRLLLEVNVSGEASKDGFSVEQLRAEWSAIQACRHLQVEGLMTMAPESDDPDDARPTFEALRRLRDELAAGPGEMPLPEMSMGMSSDFETAIESGATLVRIGSCLFAGCDESTGPPAEVSGG
ncbi:MAG: YggS family pyridoxal phosphate-dependent enzyme [Planctomycetaceae bacterium]